MKNNWCCDSPRNVNATDGASEGGVIQTACAELDMSLWQLLVSNTEADHKRSCAYQVSKCGKTILP
jgi:hypothetical protein